MSADDFPALRRQLEHDLLSWRSSTALTPAEAAEFAAITAGQELQPTAWSDVPQSQGDLLIIVWPAEVDPRSRAGALLCARPLPPQGVPLANGSHLLQGADPGVLWAPERSTSTLTLGTLLVPENNTAVLGHFKHGDLHIGAGVYVIRRQREAITPDPQPEPTRSTERRVPARRGVLGLLWDVVVD